MCCFLGQSPGSARSPADLARRIPERRHGPPHRIAAHAADAADAKCPGAPQLTRIDDEAALLDRLAEEFELSFEYC
jgi:hypothetical protein